MLRELPADDASIPGVTTLDPATTPARRPIARPNRLVRFIAGDLDPLPPEPPTITARPGRGAVPSGATSPLEGTGPASIAPPSAAVRREMARLELEAIKAELESKAGQVLPAGDASEAEGEPRA